MYTYIDIYMYDVYQAWKQVFLGLFSPLSQYHDDAPKDRQLEKAVKKIPGFVRLPLASYQFNPYIVPK